MSVTLKIVGATSTDTHKCATCEGAVVLKDSNNQDYIECRRLNLTIKRRIVECSAYIAKGFAIESYKLKALAYLIDIDLRGNVIVRNPAGRIVKGGKKRTRTVRRNRNTPVAFPGAVN